MLNRLTVVSDKHALLSATVDLTVFFNDTISILHDMEINY